jgi:heme exporter protein B
MRFVSQALLVARKDLVLELKTKESLNAAGAFAIAILLLFSFAFDPDAELLRTLAGGLLWLVFAFAGALIFNRGFSRELPNDCLDALLASPLSAASLIVGKAISAAVVLFFIELLSLAVFGIFYNKQWWGRPFELAGVFVLGSWGIAIVGAVFGALTVNLRLRELMVPVIIYPLLIPLLMAAIEVTNVLLSDGALSPGDWLWIRVLLVFDIVFTALACVLSEAILVN